MFARAEGYLPAPESAHAIRVVIDEALRCKESGQAKTIAFNLSGHGHFDLGAYERYLNGELEDTNFADLWTRANTPVYALHGASDFVTYDVDHQLIADIVNRAHPGWGRFEKVPSTDHVFSNWATEAESLQHFPTGDFNPVALGMMQRWIAQVRSASRRPDAKRGTEAAPHGGSPPPPGRGIVGPTLFKRVRRWRR